MRIIANPDIKRQAKVTNELSWLNMLYDYPHRALEEVYIFNFGPSAIKVGVNYPDKLVSLPPNEGRVFKSEDIVRLSEGIKIIYFRSFPGLLAQVKVEGTFL